MLLILDSIVGFLAVAMILSGILTIILLIIIFVIYGGEADEDDGRRRTGRAIKIVVPAFVFFLLAAALTPSTKIAIAMYVIPPVMNSEAAKKAPDIFNKSLELIDKKLDESLGNKK